MIGMLIDLTQDTEFILPLAKKCKEKGVRYRVFISRSATQKDLQLIKKLRNEKINFDREILPKRFRDKYCPWLKWPRLSGVHDFVTAVETNANPHRLAHAIALRANFLGITTFTLQHGFENIGLTYSDNQYPINKVKINSQFIFTWGMSETLHKEIQDETHRKCIPIGIPKTYEPRVSSLVLSKNDRLVIGLFENLHWNRYDDCYRSSFIDLIEFLPKRFPNFEFRLKPHPAGRWMTNRFKGTYTKEKNLVVYDSSLMSQEKLSNNDFINGCDIVITTPSSVAIDGVSLGKPTIVLKYNLDLDNYKPLPLAGDNLDVEIFVKDILDRPKDFLNYNKSFLDNKIVKMDAVEDIIKWIKEKKHGE